MDGACKGSHNIRRTMSGKTDYLVDLAKTCARLDGRKEDEFRKIEIQKGLIEKAEGSALVKLGSTQILAGVKMEVKEPFPDTPNEGVLVVGAELSPIASPEFGSGPPDENSIELARIVDRSIRESHAIDTEKLCIVEKEKVWFVNVDLYILDDSGNLIDASALAAISALMDSKMPKYDGEKIIYEEKTKKLPLTCKPVAVTHVKVAESLFADPVSEEEQASTARMTVGTKDNGNICALQKGGTEGLTLKQAEHLFEKSIEIGKTLRKLL